MEAAVGRVESLRRSPRPWIRVAALVGIASTQVWAGELTRRYELSLQRVLEGGEPRYDLPLLVADVIPDDSRVFTNFSGDLSGRYLGALASAGRTDRALEVLPELLAHQRPDGRFGNPLSASGATADDMARLWGAGRMLVGLVELYEASGDGQASEAARKLGDWLVAQAPRFNDDVIAREFYSGKLANGYVCWTQNVEALTALADAVDEARYREVAAEIARRIRRMPGQHTHGWLTSMRGLLALRLPAEEWGAFVRSADLLPTGSVSEYFPPGLSRDEGCSHADWVRWNLAMGPEERYVAAAEKALFNGFYPNQSAAGGFGHLRFTERGFAPGHEEAWWCCTLHGLRAFRDIQDAAFRAADEGKVRYLLPIDGEIDVELPGGRLHARAESTLEMDNRVRIEVLDGSLEDLEFRQPAWSGPIQVTRESSTATITYAPLERTVDGVAYQGPWIVAAPVGGDGEMVRLADRTWASPQVEWRFLPEERKLTLTKEKRPTPWKPYAGVALTLAAAWAILRRRRR